MRCFDVLVCLRCGDGIALATGARVDADVIPRTSPGPWLDGQGMVLTLDFCTLPLHVLNTSDGEAIPCSQAACHFFFHRTPKHPLPPPSSLSRLPFQDNGGYLMKRRSMTQPWTCVHGGTSATLVALLEGRTLLTANVGDSSALLAMQGRRLEVRVMVWCWS